VKAPVKWKSAAARRLSAQAGGLSIDKAIPAIVANLIGDHECPPTDLEYICSKLNVALIEDDDIPVVGELRRVGKHFVIVCARGQSHERRRFTIAHELAHALLESIGARSPRSSDETERLCEMIAAEILMPKAVFRTALGEEPMTGAAISGLARQFHASLTATAIRCTEFRLVSIVDIQNGQWRWMKGPVRPARHQVESLVRQKAGDEDGDGLIFVEFNGSTQAFNGEWLRFTPERSGLLVLTPHDLQRVSP
jgi:Zn-dependent peptidase ImmA (M78 family)